MTDPSPSQLPIDERPIVAREHGQGRAGASPDERYGDGSSFGGVDGVQGSPPKAPPRILRSGEGSRPHESREGIRVLPYLGPTLMYLLEPTRPVVGRKVQLILAAFAVRNTEVPVA